MITFISLIEAIAKLAWPVIAFIALLWFRQDISTLLTRTRKAKVLGDEFEFEAEKDKLSEDVKDVLEAADITTEKRYGEIIDARAKEEYGSASHIKNLGWSYGVLDYALAYLEEKIKTEPEVAVVIISFQIEKMLRIVIARGGVIVPNRGISSFAEYGHMQNNGPEISEVARLGLELLTFVYERQPQPILIDEVGLSVFEDEKCQTQIELYEGLHLLFVAVPGATGARMTVVTRRHDYYREGMEVTAESEV